MLGGGGWYPFPVPQSGRDQTPGRRAHYASVAHVARVYDYLLGGQAGLRQFLDIGTGMPASSNIHEVAQSVAPDARVVYVDHDPIVLCHARALLISAPEGRTDFLEADLRQPVAIRAEDDDAAAPAQMWAGVAAKR